jgi:hypothetical protein
MPPGLQAKCDGQIDAFWPQLQADEAAYFAAHGGYWQGLITHQSGIPANGDDVLPDVGALTPTDQPAPWPAAYLASPLAEALVVDVYAGPLGHGYVLTAFVQTTPPHVPLEAAHRWKRALAFGPEPGRDQDWVVAPEGLV